MDFTTWQPVYAAILADMGYDRTADERARDRLAELVGENDLAGPPSGAFLEQSVAIAAPGPPLAGDLEIVRSADQVLAAGAAADRLLEAGIEPDWVVTDLDGHPEQVPEFTHCGIPVAIHAHGDNRDLLESVVPACDLEAVIPTTQSAPVGPVRNFGGFTDGDRAAFFADAVGAGNLVFPGWDLDDRSVDPAKRSKLDWAARLLAWLERRRGERFSVLADVRGDLDLSAIPESS